MMRLIAFTILLLFGAVCQKTEVSVNQPQNSNAPTRVLTENTKKEGVDNPFGNNAANSSAANKSTPTASANGVEKRCGWLENPTPGNFWFTDADGEWTIGVQGGYQADGTDNLPDFESEWVKTNGYYGYGCICMDVKVDKKEQKVVEIKKATVRPLSACRKDKNLKEPRE